MSQELKIATIEDVLYAQVLTTTAGLVEFPLSEEDQQLIEAMKTKLMTLGGVGLAAPQVNCAKQIIAIYISQDAAVLREEAVAYPMHILINPTYKPLTTDLVSDFEACYSVSSKAGKVPRFREIELEYYDEKGQYHQQIETGFYARVLQHEIDHLNGVLITDRLGPDCAQGTMQQMMELRRSELSDEKKIIFDQLMEKKLAKNND